jgi:hypothetical protein
MERQEDWGADEQGRSDAAPLLPVLGHQKFDEN